jgi:uncharacterized protein (TIGR03437 family)
MNLNRLRSGQNMLSLHWKTALAMALCTAACSRPGLAQAAPPSILQIDTGNVVLYTEDTSDLSRFATDPNLTTAVPPRNFSRTVAIADIVAVNGQPVMGTHVRGAIGNLGLRTAPGPGQAIADTERAAVAVFTFEILKIDGTPIGTIVANGLATGAAPPGAPLTVTAGNNFAITGGTGAFLGARGQLGAVAPPPGVAAGRGASMTEDPANRRRNGGGTQRWIAHLIPMSSPQILTTASGPAVSHFDLSPVTAAKPARSGEVLIVQATGLGPTLPGVDPGQPFPTEAILPVNSPLVVTVNGRDAEVVNGIGWPGMVDTYRVDFRVPEGTAAGTASVQLSAAWMAGTAVRIAVQ